MSPPGPFVKPVKPLAVLPILAHAYLPKCHVTRLSRGFRQLPLISSPAQTATLVHQHREPRWWEKQKVACFRAQHTFAQKCFGRCSSSLRSSAFPEHSKCPCWLEAATKAGAAHLTDLSGDGPLLRGYSRSSLHSVQCRLQAPAQIEAAG